MYTLFIDTHDTTLIALFKDMNIIDNVISEDRQQSTKVLPLINKILEENKLKTSDLNEILVVNGPGSFTGVRIGVTIAKTISYTLNIPIKTITSIELLAIFDDYKNNIYAVLDPKGAYIGNFKNNKFNYEYLTKNEINFDNMVTNVSADFSMIKKYYDKFKEYNSKEVNPLYIKKIEAIK